METTAGQATKRPFHETIIDTIKDVAQGPSNIMGAEFCNDLRGNAKGIGDPHQGDEDPKGPRRDHRSLELGGGGGGVG